MKLDAYRLRRATIDDLPALYRVCLRTGAAGDDATDVEDDPELLGRVYVGPYVTFEPKLAFALVGPEGVVGYVLGVLDTRRFNRKLKDEWLPKLQRAERDPGDDPTRWRGSDWVRHAVHHPFLELPPVLASYPSHAHIDLLEDARGHGIGRHMMQTMMECLAGLGSPGVHLQVNPRNAGAQAFYRSLGFVPISSTDLPEDTLFMARRIADDDEMAGGPPGGLVS
ncbi:GNAT family N-acetyltransferase [Taklimakanibacter lacteus]|uniref:GNAT family N-acetyltransferase n=1 Tax=Taklimakanibacter lacteus TaxID=2268456 RepID=UPI000E6650A3